MLDIKIAFCYKLENSQILIFFDYKRFQDIAEYRSYKN